MSLKFVCLVGVLLSTLCESSAATAADDKNKLNRIVMKRSSSDQESSATGYIYRQDGIGPASIVYLNQGEVNGHFQGNPIPYSYTGGLASKPYGINNAPVSAAFTGLPNTPYTAPYQQHPAFKQADVFTQSLPQALGYNQPSFKPRVSYKVVAPIHVTPIQHHVTAPTPITIKSEPLILAGDSGSSEDYDVETDNASGSDEHLESGLRRYSTSGAFSPSHRLAPYTHQGIHNGHQSHYNKEGGSEYGEDKFAKHGEKGTKGYNNEHAYSKGDKGSHASEHHTGYYDHHGAKKASEFDQGEHFDKNEHGAKGSKGGKFGEKKHHKKGSKTTGYHNVFHKDEFKKDHTFYDDADHKGHFTKYGSDHDYNKNDAGKYNIGGHKHSGYEQGHHGKKGHTDDGKYDQADAGYKSQYGDEQYHSHNQDYGKKGGSEYGNQHKYSKEGGGH